MKTLLASMLLAACVTGSGVANAGSEMTCTMTGETVEQCCCVEKNGAMVCTLTGETVSSCCCVSASK